MPPASPAATVFARMRDILTKSSFHHPPGDPAAALFARVRDSEPALSSQAVIRPQQMKADPKYQENSASPAQPPWPDYDDLGPVKPLNTVRILIAYVGREP